MDYKELTLDDIEIMESEINHYYKMRKLFLGLGWGLIGTSIIVAIIGGINIPASNGAYNFLIYLASTLFCAGLILFVLRGALYNRRIKNRKILIKQATEYQERRRSFGEEDE